MLTMENGTPLFKANVVVLTINISLAMAAGVACRVRTSAVSATSREPVVFAGHDTASYSWERDMEASTCRKMLIMSV